MTVTNSLNLKAAKIMSKPLDINELLVELQRHFQLLDERFPIENGQKQVDVSA